jgi:twinkle protein
MSEQAEFIKHVPCEECGSSDANSLYSDGHTYCFSCRKHSHGTETRQERKRMSGLLSGEFQSLTKRGITEDTCRKYGYKIGTLNGRPVQIAPYHDAGGNEVAQKVRFPTKDFTVTGDMKQGGLFGQNLFDGGKKLVVTEGEIDCLTVSQLQGNKWPVVSIPTGASGAKKAIAKALDWLEGFEEVIFMFDMDQPGREAAQECAGMLPPGKAKIASLPLKDPNECLMQGKSEAVIQAIWNAKAYRPDGIVAGQDLWQDVLVEDSHHSVPYPWETLNEKTHGLRMGELVTVTAGSGIGKSAIIREIAYSMLNMGETIGMIMLEESTKRTALGLMGLHLNAPLHIDRKGVTEAQMKEAFDATVGNGRCYLYDHFGSTEIDNLLARVRYLAKACECKWIFLDHLSIVVSGLGDGDERRLIDNAMTALRSLVQETGVGLILVSHLKRPEGKGHEEGAATSLSQLRGSHAIAQLSDMVLGLERNQQGENPNETQVRVLKNRFSGETGLGATLAYDALTGRLNTSTGSQNETQQENEDF